MLAVAREVEAGNHLCKLADLERSRIWEGRSVSLSV